MEVQYGKLADITSWMDLVQEVKGNFPGLETADAVKEHENTVLKFMLQNRALCMKDQDQGYHSLDLSGGRRKGTAPRALYRKFGFTEE